jgi:hypothetical protein
MFMPLMSPGIKGGTETIIAATARQFCERHEGRDTTIYVGKGLQFHMYTDTFHVVDTSREHRRAFKWGPTSVTMIPVMGPRHNRP